MFIGVGTENYRICHFTDIVHYTRLLIRLLVDIYTIKSYLRSPLQFGYWRETQCTSLSFSACKLSSSSNVFIFGRDKELGGHSLKITICGSGKNWKSPQKVPLKIVFIVQIFENSAQFVFLFLFFTSVPPHIKGHQRQKICY